MAEVQFHFDEHMSNDVARELRRWNINVETTVDAGLQHAPDSVNLVHAHNRGRVVVTMDADFAELHTVTQEHSGIVYFPGKRRRSIGEIVESLRLIHSAFTAEEMVGRLEYL